MRNAIALGTLIAFTTAFSASAQNAPMSPPSSSPSSTPAAASSPRASTIHPDVKSHLTVGAQIFSGDKVVGTVATFDDAAGKVIINEPSIGAGASVAITRVLPASSISWSNNRLVTTMTAEQIKTLPNR